MKSFLVAGVLLLTVYATHSSAETIAELNQRLGICTATAERGKKTQCFEQLSRDAIGQLEKRDVEAVIPINKATPVVSLSKYADLIAKAKSNITRDFKDTASVQWRNVFVSDGTVPALCGEVNAKNSYGAYVGFRRFFATSQFGLQEVENPKDPYVLETMWKSMCSKLVETVE